MNHFDRFKKTLKSHVFISHNKNDREEAAKIAIFLTTEHINVWFDEWEITAGDSIIDEIENGLKKCTHFVILWSKNSSKSKWVREELKSALIDAIAKQRIQVIPILLDETEKPPLLKDKKHIVYHGGTEEDRDEIVEGIIGNKPNTSFARAIVKMYNEIVFGEVSRYDPFGIKVCPKCGSDQLQGSTITDYRRDDVYATLTCKKCGWRAGTEA